MLLEHFPLIRLAVTRLALRWSHGNELVLRGLADLPVHLFSDNLTTTRP